MRLPGPVSFNSETSPDISERRKASLKLWVAETKFLRKTSRFFCCVDEYSENSSIVCGRRFLRKQ